MDLQILEDHTVNMINTKKKKDWKMYNISYELYTCIIYCANCIKNYKKNLSDTGRKQVVKLEITIYNIP